MAARNGKGGKVYWADVAVAFQRAIRAFDDFVKPVLDRHGKSDLGVANVLFLLNVGDGERRISQLVREQRYVGSNASYALSALVDAGLVERHNDPKDRRIRVVTLTEEGRRLVEDIRQVSEGDDHAIKTALDTVIDFETHCAQLPA